MELAHSDWLTAKYSEEVLNFFLSSRFVLLTNLPATPIDHENQGKEGEGEEREIQEEEEEEEIQEGEGEGNCPKFKKNELEDQQSLVLLDDPE